MVLFLAVLGVEQALELVAFIHAQPLGVGRAIVEVEVSPDAHRCRHQAFNCEQPLPAVAAEHPVQFE
jgi:hypothetical protein